MIELEDNARARTLLVGFYVNAALAYGLIGGASIAWHDKPAFLLTLLGVALAVISYLAQVVYKPRCLDRNLLALRAVVYASWALPGLALVQLLMRS